MSLSYRVSSVILLLFFASVPSVSYGAETAVPRTALLGLAREFVTRVEKGFDKADAFWAQTRSPKTMDVDVNMPDGEMLILNPRIGEKELTLPYDIIAFKQGSDAYISLRDLFSAAGFAINVDPVDGKAQGWFVREDQPFLLDIPAEIVEVNGKSFVFHSEDVRREQDDIYVLGAALGEWFGASFWPRFSSQFLDVSFAQKLPVEEKILRRKRQLAERTIMGPPEQPRIEKEYEAASIPNAVFSVNHVYRDPGGDNESTKRTRYSMIASGDVAKMTGETFIGGDAEEGIENVRVTLSRDSDRPELLGPFQARRFEVGDVTPTRLPLTGSSSQELGVRITNKETNAPPQFSTTEFSGNAEPDWDIELYRNEHLVSFQTVDETGRYAFEDVELFVGNNDFRIVKYGPQGEVQEETKTVVVDPSRVAGKSGRYDVSVSLSDEQTYMRRSLEDQDKGTPHVVANYEKVLGRNLALRGGLRSRQEEGQDKVYMQAGVSATVADTLVDTDVAVDEQGEAAFEIVGRRKIEKHDLRAGLELNTEDYSPGQRRDDNRILSVTASLKGPVAAPHTTYTFGTRYQEQESGASRFNADAGLATRLGGNRLNQNLSYELKDGVAGETERVNGTSSIRGSFNKMRWRGLASYEISPETRMESLLFDLSRKLSKSLSARFELEHDIEPDVTEGRLSMNLVTDHFIVSPRIEMNTEEEVLASVNMRFGVTRDPYGGDIVVSSKQLSQRGGVSARVFLDRDGSMDYSEGDELLEGVSIKSLHTHGEAFTDERGIAFLYDLQANRLTDIVVNRDSLDDPFWLPAREGVSVRPRPGAVQEVSFPVHISGEIDGTVYIVSEDGSRRVAGGVRMGLYDMDGVKVQESAAAYDGFYLFSQVPPGRYYLAINEESAKALHVSRPLPQLVEFDYKGTIIYGHDLFMTEEGGVPFVMAADYKSFVRKNPGLDAAGLDKDSVILNLGEYNSRLLMGVVWYRLAKRYGSILGGDSLLVLPSQSEVSSDRFRHVLRVKLADGTLENAQNKCRALMARGFPCSVEMNPALPAQKAEQKVSLETGKKYSFFR